MQFGLSNRFFFVAERGVVYFRIFGYGLWLATYRRLPALFSERNGLDGLVVLKTKNWRVRALKRDDQ